MTSGKFQRGKEFCRLDIDFDKLKKFGVTRRLLQKHMKEALEAMARHWHDKFLPRHFDESAYDRYRYTKRKGMDKDGIRRRAEKNLKARRLKQLSAGSKKVIEVNSDTIEAEFQRVYNRTYTRRKERQFRHNDPLNFTGQGMLEALSVAKIRGNSKEARVILPSKFNFKHPNSRVNMREEITRIIPSEATELVEIGRRALRAAIARKQ